MSVQMEDNSEEVLRRLAEAMGRGLEKIGMKAETYAKNLCRVGTTESVGRWAKDGAYRGGTLKNSITHAVDGDVLNIGSNVEYAPYVELGTGPHFKPPPEWEDFDAPRGKGVGRAYVKPRAFLRPAIESHADEYREIMENELKNG